MAFTFMTLSFMFLTSLKIFLFFSKKGCNFKKTHFVESREQKRQCDVFELLQIVRTAQKGLYVGKYEVLSGEASRKRRLSGF